MSVPPAPEVVEAARAQIRNRFGRAMAEKASSALCLSLGSQGTFLAAAETATRYEPRATILEFDPGPQRESASVELAQDPSSREEWKTVVQAVRNLRTPDASTLWQARDLLRSKQVKAASGRFRRAAAEVTMQIERGARGFFRPGPETTASPYFPSSATEVCWLNQTARAWVDPTLLADVAEDRKIARLDLPRRIEPELATTAATVGATPYRKQSGHTGKGVIIAVIDHEVAHQHPAFQDRVVPRQNYSREPWGAPAAHGTAVAGIVGANSPGLMGIAPDATLYNYKVLASNRALNGDDFDGTLAIQAALEDGAHIANCSWGNGPARKRTSREAAACNTAWANGMLIVKSAGNWGPVTTPGDAEGVIVVGATDQEGVAVQPYSSRGPLPNGKQRPHLVAPGGTLERGIESCLVSGGFGDCGFGTSLAAPHVTGLLALLLQDDPDQSPNELRELLLRCCSPLEGTDAATQGAGLVSLARLL